MTEPSSDRTEPAAAASTRRRIGRGAARLLYRLVRPVVRPLAYRLRSFLNAPQQETLNAIQQRISTQQESFQALQHHILALNAIATSLHLQQEAMNALRHDIHDLRETSNATWSACQSELHSMSKTLRDMAEETERVILTLATDAPQFPAHPCRARQDDRT